MNEIKLLKSDHLFKKTYSFTKKIWIPCRQIMTAVESQLLHQINTFYSVKFV
jgi:hypothetical protein